MRRLCPQQGRRADEGSATRPRKGKVRNVGPGRVRRAETLCRRRSRRESRRLRGAPAGDDSRRQPIGTAGTTRDDNIATMGPWRQSGGRRRIRTRRRTHRSRSQTGHPECVEPRAPTRYSRTTRATRGANQNRMSSDADVRLRVGLPERGRVIAPTSAVVSARSLCTRKTSPWSGPARRRPPIKWTAERSESFLTTRTPRHVTTDEMAMDGAATSSPCGEDARQHGRYMSTSLGGRRPGRALLAGPYKTPAIYRVKAIFRTPPRSSLSLRPRPERPTSSSASSSRRRAR